MPFLLDMGSDYFSAISVPKKDNTILTDVIRTTIIVQVDLVKIIIIMLTDLVE